MDWITLTAIELMVNYKNTCSSCWKLVVNFKSHFSLLDRSNLFKRRGFILKKDDQLNRRFITYMANLIYYNSINYDKKRRMKNSRFPLTLDNDENLESTLLISYDSESVPLSLKDHITNYSLYQAYESLPEQQKKILSLAYAQGLNDKEISEIVGGSQQNISKHRLKALAKLRLLITEGKGKGEDSCQR